MTLAEDALNGVGLDAEHGANSSRSGRFVVDRKA